MNANLTTEAAQAWNFYHNPRQPYDDFLVEYIFKPMRLEVVRRNYNRALANFSAEISYLPHRLTHFYGLVGDDWFKEIIALIEAGGIHELYDFLAVAANRSQAQGYIAAAKIPQPSLMGWLEYLKGFWFPFPANLRQLVDPGDPRVDKILVRLKTLKIANSLALLDAAADEKGRAWLASQAEIDADGLLDLVHRADVSRLPYVSGGAVKRLWAMGYRSLEAIRAADETEYQERITAYFAAGGKGWGFDAQLDNIRIFLRDAQLVPTVLAA